MNTNDYYTIDELSFIDSLIKKSDIKSCYKKAFFLKKSGSDLFILLWKIYVDYYAYINPKLERFIMKKQKNWEETNDNINIIYVIKNLYISRSSDKVFELRNYVMNGGNVNYIYIKKNKKERENKYTNLNISIKKRHFKNVAYELMKLTNNDTVNEIINIVIEYFTLFYGSCDRDMINEKMSKRPVLHENIMPYYILALIFHLYEDIVNIRNACIIVTPRKEEVEYYSSLE